MVARSTATSLTAKRERKLAPAHRAWRGRSRFVFFFLTLGFVFGAFGAFRLQAMGYDDYADRAERQYMRSQAYVVPRRKIVDRNGVPLAVSAMRPNVIADPQVLLSGEYSAAEVAKALAAVLQIDRKRLQKRLHKVAGKRYLLVKRNALPSQIERLRSLSIKGVTVEPAYRRYYPAGEVAAPLLGLTNIEEHGQEGLERAFDEVLQVPKEQSTVKRARNGEVVEILEQGRLDDEAEPLQLAIDRRIQYVAYRELKRAMNRHQAKSAAMVIMDAQNSELLAMVSLPSFNPHQRDKIDWRAVQNRTIGYSFEPGSTMKPLVVAAALQQGVIDADYQTNTSPGRYSIGRSVVRDSRNYGQLNLTGILAKSSNVGTSRIALKMEPEELWRSLRHFGFGISTATGLPNEANGRLPHYEFWEKIDQASLSYGYGISVTPIQLAQAYAIIASGGERRYPMLTRDAGLEPDYVLDPDVAAAVLSMMEAVVGPQGTAPKAAIAGYRVAGKTGTSRKVSRRGGYTEDDYLAVFAGIVPVSKPRFVAVVLVDDPDGDDYYGGLVAAPVFSKVMSDVLRMMDVPPDAYDFDETVAMGEVQ